MNPTKLTREFTVTPERLATRFESGTVEVLATPAIIAMMEGTACDLAQLRLSEGITTVGTEVNIAHSAASPLGAKITVTAELLESDGRSFTFRVEASDPAGVVASGTHKRASVKQATFAEKATARLAAAGSAR